MLLSVFIIWVQALGGEESRSKRHLMEYWHIKAELTFGDREDIISLVEDIISYLTKKCAEDGKEVF